MNKVLLILALVSLPCSGEALMNEVKRLRTENVQMKKENEKLKARLEALSRKEHQKRDKRAARAEKEKALEMFKKKASFDFVNTPLKDVAAFFSNLTNANIVVHPAIADEKITLKGKDMRIASALSWMARQLKVTSTIVKDAACIGPAYPVKKARTANAFKKLKDEQVLEILEKRISFDFVNTPLPDVRAFLQNLTSMNIISTFAPERERKIMVTLRLTDARLADALVWVAFVCDANLEAEENIIALSPDTKKTQQAF